MSGCTARDCSSASIWPAFRNPRRDPTLVIHAAAEEALPPLCRRRFATLSDYMDGTMDDTMRDGMQRHLRDCGPCQALLAGIRNAVAQCRSYAPQCDATRAEELRQVLLPRYQQAVVMIGKT